MKVCWQGFLGKSHSWAMCGQNICREFKSQNNEVQMFSTNGISHFPEDLKSNLLGYQCDVNKQTYGRLPDNDYDLEISYTAPPNFSRYLGNSSKSKKFGIWAWEFNGIDNKSTFPNGFAKNYKYTDKILAPSSFCLQGYLNAGVPKEFLEVVPHGINNNFLINKEKYEIKTNRKIKFLLNVGGQLHKRKQVSKTLEAWGKAFTNKDDVVLIAKISDKIPTQAFEEYWKDLFKTFRSKYKDHAPIVMITNFIDDISSLYNATDIVISSGQEGFNLPALEAHYSNNLFIGLNYGGHLDFCNDKNSLLIKGKLVRCPQDYQYWQPSQNSLLFEPDVLHYSELLQRAAKQKNKLMESFKSEIEVIKENYTWNKVCNQIVSIYNKIK